MKYFSFLKSGTITALDLIPARKWMTTNGPPLTYRSIAYKYQNIYYHRLSGNEELSRVQSRFPCEFFSRQSQYRSYSNEARKTVNQDDSAKKRSGLPQTSVSNVPSKEHNNVGPNKNKEPLLVRFKKEMLHYWIGTKLLGTEIKISSRLLAKSMSGKKLLRRERRQLKRTIADLARLIPFIAIVLIPFMEFALPIIIKLFPGFLPSTFHTEDSITLKKLNLQKTRLEAAKLLRASEIERADKSQLNASSKVLSKFLVHIDQKVLSLSTDDMVEITKLFPNTITIQELPRSQLVNICKYLDIVSIGPDTLLKAFIQRRLNYLNADDHTIAHESTSNYNATELKQICTSRGMRVFSKTEDQLRAQLDIWLDLTVNKKVPNALLILSNATELVNDELSPANEPDSKLQSVMRTIYNLPEEILLAAKMNIKEADGTATFEERLSFLKDQEEEIEKELSENEQRIKNADGSSPSNKLRK